MAKRKSYSQRKNMMNNNKLLRLVIIPCLLVFIASGIYLIWWQNNKNSTATNIEYIRSFMSSSGQLRDYQNKLNMHDPEKDIKWYKTTKEIRIEFGRIFLTWEPEEFYTDEVQAQLNTIGFTTEIKKDSDGNRVLHLYYNGEEVERWVK